MLAALSLNLVGGIVAAKMFWRKRKQTQSKPNVPVSDEPIQDINGAGMLGLLLTADFYTDADYASMFRKLLYTDTDFTKENISIIAHDVFELAINSSGPRRLVNSGKQANIKLRCLRRSWIQFQPNKEILFGKG